MSIQDDNTTRASDFINESEKAATAAEDSGRVAKLESDQKIHPYFTRLGKELNGGETINGGTTPVPVYQKTTDGELYACDANDTDKLRFIGFVETNGSDGIPARFQSSGIVGGFTSLDEGVSYYVQDTAGTIGATPGTQRILVGVAISETELLIQFGPLRAAGSTDAGNVGASGSEAITTGFRPTRIKISAYNSGTGHINVMEAIWVNGVMVGVGANYNEGTSSIIDANPRLWSSNTGGGGTYLSFSITNVTETGFTITYIETGSYSDDTGYIWEAEGDT